MPPVSPSRPGSSRGRLTRLLPLGGLACLILAPPLFAQSGSDLLLEPLPRPGTEEQPPPALRVEGSYRYQFDAEVEETGSDLGLDQITGSGRYHFLNQRNERASLGASVLHLDLDAADPLLPTRLLDASLSTGYVIRSTDGYQSLGLAGGVGYAGDTPFANGQAIYALADLTYTIPLSRSSQLALILNYNGNRGLWPDLPLPALAYSRQYSDELTYTLGLPYSSVDWHPLDRVRLRAEYNLPLTFSTRADYELTRAWTLFTSFDNQFDAFHLDGEPFGDHRRLFFSQQRVEAGVRASTSNPDAATLTLAGGYAFSQEFQRGYDVRDLETIREIDPAPYLRLGLELRF